MKIAIIANTTRADSDTLSTETLDKLAQEYDLSYDLFLVEPEDIQPLLEDLAHKSYNTFLIAGGDGTVRSAVQVLANYDAPIAILPLGTFNYFARELNFPNDIADTFKIIKNNKIKTVDVAEINGILFINHTAIGFYSYVLKLKEKYKHIFKNYKILKVIFTALNFLKVIPAYSLTLNVNQQEHSYKTCMVFIGNNYHFTNFLDFGTRQTLSGGMLSVYIFNCHTRWGLIKCLYSILFNTAQKPHYLIEYLTKEIIISSESPQINVDIDGELHKLASPLHYLIHKKQLSIVVP